MKQVVTLFVVALIVTAASVATAASPQDVQKFIKTLNKNSKILLSHKVLESGTTEAVYVIKKKRYTAIYYGDRIFFYIRPNGTSSSQVINLISGSGGKVYTGAYTGAEAKQFSRMTKLGLDNESYWQKAYDNAITDTINHFK